MDAQRPNWMAVESLIDDLRRSFENMGTLQHRLMSITGTAWSPDRMIKAVVGPRGQLVELEIDPRVYRTPNSTKLAATIVATVHAAVDVVLRQTTEIIGGSLPRDAAGFAGESPVMRMARQHDADVLKQAAEGDDD